ncbi:MAG: ATP-dependent helicase [Desulfovibrio sp.]|jgi:DNA helicase-2/ATP-dependent DNA helicase PcrA|nr:ATP-dependent helicase [Desulfovibrio sp.]
MIDYQRDLNAAQFEAVTTLEGPVLVIAGAGSGKTRTIVYRLARLVETGVCASSILLLTFTRKAAREMLDRARELLWQSLPPDRAGREEGDRHDLGAMQGGTFHSYAFSVLRIFRPGTRGRRLTVMDNHDILAAFQHCREESKIGRGDRSFPKNQTINAILSKSRNKELPIEEVIRRDARHLLAHSGAICDLGLAYARYKEEKDLLDYDDLLFSLEETLLTCPQALDYCRTRHQYVMVDEYQDTNAVQARIVALISGLSDPPGMRGDEGCVRSKTPQSAEPDGTRLSPFSGNLMVVGDDAQSIYAFRGADVRNILDFPKLCEGVKIIRLEENYRSTQPVLDLCNTVLKYAGEGYAKRLYTRRSDGELPGLVRPLSDRSQAGFVAARILELMRVYKPEDIAVLFRAAFHSFALELALNKQGLPFKKYGGIRYTDAAHIKDALSYMRLVHNPLDFPAFSRMAELSRGVGPKTCLKMYQAILVGEAAVLNRESRRHPEFSADLAFLEGLRNGTFTPAELLSEVAEHYAPRLEELYPDDYPRRMQEIEHLIQIASAYRDLDVLLADLSIEDPENRHEAREALTLSTIHSAKGLEWEAVIILDLVEDRFPSRHALTRPEDFEEERRLMYVACTRARTVLELYVPESIYDRAGGGSIPAVPSPFVRELAPGLYREFRESYGGRLVEKKRLDSAAGPVSGRGALQNKGPAAGCKDTGDISGGDPDYIPLNCVSPGDVSPGDIALDGETLGEAVLGGPAPDCMSGRSAGEAAGTFGFCRHRIFGRGKIVQYLPPDRVRVNFPGIGLKVIMSAYLCMEN